MLCRGRKGFNIMKHMESMKFSLRDRIPEKGASGPRMPEPQK